MGIPATSDELNSAPVSVGLENRCENPRTSIAVPMVVIGVRMILVELLV